MGTSADGDGRPDHDGLPELPAEWGRIVIPDDPAELAAEAELVRRELRLRTRSPAGPRRFGMSHGPRDLSTVRLSLLIMSIAVLATLTSLFAVSWPGPQRPPVTARTELSGPSDQTLPALDVVDENGTLVPLRGLLPAVILLVDDCACADEIAAAARAAPPGITVVALTGGHRAAGPSTGPPPGAAPVRSLADPAGGLRAALRLPSRPAGAAALLVARSGRIIRTVPALTSAADYQADLPGLLATW